MRVLTASLLAAQKSQGVKPLVKVALTKTGSTSYTYTNTRLIEVDHEERADSQTAILSLDNSDAVLTAIDLQGYTATLSHGAITTAGDEYDAVAPLYVVRQEFIDARPPTKNVCKLTCIGIPDLLAMDRASAAYVPLATNTDTVKTILTSIFGATMAVFNHCTAYTVDYDSEDSLIDSFQPKDGWRISERETRLAAAKRLLGFTKCVMLVKADGHIHISVPTTAAYSVDVGSAATNRASTYLPGYTIIDRANPVNLSGTITSVQIWAATDLTGCRVGVFYLVSGTTYKCRDSATIGSVTAGSAQTFVVSLEAMAGDHIGCYYATGGIETDLTGGTEVRYATGDQSATGNSFVTSTSTDAAISLYATGVAYDYEYSLDVGYHAFFAKAYRQKVIRPNYITVHTLSGAGTAYSGTAQATAYTSYPTTLQQRDSIIAAVTSNAQAGTIAQARIANLELEIEGGSVDVPMNVGEEIHDFVLVTSSRAGDSRTGNIGYIHRQYVAGKTAGGQGWHMTFGFGAPNRAQNIMSTLENAGSSAQGVFQDIFVKGTIYADDLQMQSQADTSLTYGWLYSTAISAGLIKLDAVYEDPSGTYSLVRRTAINAGYIELNSYTRASTVAASSEWYRKSGVVIDATKGIYLIGSEAATLAFATYDSATAAASGSAQCYMDTSGRLAAGAGAVLLSKDGLAINGQFLQFSAGTLSVNNFIWASTSDGSLNIQAESGKNLNLSPLTGTIMCGQNVLPNGSLNLGSTASPWLNGFYTIVRAATIQALTGSEVYMGSNLIGGGVANLGNSTSGFQTAYIKNIVALTGGYTELQNNAYLRLPNKTAAPASSTDGMCYYDTALQVIKVYLAGVGWKTIAWV